MGSYRYGFKDLPGEMVSVGNTDDPSRVRMRPPGCRFDFDEHTKNSKHVWHEGPRNGLKDSRRGSDPSRVHHWNRRWHPSDRDRPNDAIIAPGSPAPSEASSKGSGPVHVRSWEKRDEKVKASSKGIPRGTNSFDPKEVSSDARHTAPFMTSLCRRTLGSSQSSPMLRGATIGCRPHAQGNMPSCVAGGQGRSVTMSAIPGYTGHIRGKTCENVYALTYMLGNEAAHTAVETREPPSPREFRLTTQKMQPQAWQDEVAKSWRENVGGITHQEGRHGKYFAERLNLSESMRRQHNIDKTERDSTKLRTWAHPQPELEKNVNMHRSGIVGYQGHRPFWREERDFFERREVGKVHPPYLPMATGNDMASEYINS
eukprot:gnl/MRDRNA2_/MRDRNA2_101155_c0_seq1.p1 gnl/MRDRNA2_/MRDRNA2_101155_c0~~gnl/MRDRNA2_/MRDRNA2_101155_c0_seq1.p1  ORF type:complete len:371 (+),score=37.88 gnl/MRDRNA2_/MRDRNA2_101155_c0_seq1:105-1217(+)